MIAVSYTHLEYNVYEHKIEKLKKELADAHKETIRVRNYWFQILEDMLREFEKAQKRSAQELRKMEIRALNAEKQRDDACLLYTSSWCLTKSITQYLKPVVADTDRFFMGIRYLRLQCLDLMS